MPFYRCRIESPLTSETVLLRVRGVVRETPGFFQSIKESWGSHNESSPPFIGTVDGATFRIHRDIRYRNSFLPRIRGSVVSLPSGSRLHLTMRIHPVVFVFMLFWQSLFGFLIVFVLMSPERSVRSVAVFAGSFLFGIVLAVAGFFPEAIKARRLLEQCLENTSEQPLTSQPVE